MANENLIKEMMRVEVVAEEVWVGVEVVEILKKK